MQVSVTKAILARMLGRSRTIPPPQPLTEKPVMEPVIVERCAMRPRGAPEYAYETRNFGKTRRVRVEYVWTDDAVLPKMRRSLIRGRRPARKPRYKTEHVRRRI